VADVLIYSKPWRHAWGAQFQKHRRRLDWRSHGRGNSFGSVSSAQRATIPISGHLARVAMDPELLPSGPKPLVNLRRPMDDPHPNGGGDPLPLVGDYNNPS
jgi:hypothetical protein